MECEEILSVSSVVSFSEDEKEDGKAASAATKIATNDTGGKEKNSPTIVVYKLPTPTTMKAMRNMRNIPVSTRIIQNGKQLVNEDRQKVMEWEIKHRCGGHTATPRHDRPGSSVVKG